MFALASAVVFFLMSLDVVHDTENMKYLPLALGLLALHFAISIPIMNWPNRGS